MKPTNDPTQCHMALPSALMVFFPYPDPGLQATLGSMIVRLQRKILSSTLGHPRADFG